MLQVPIPQNQIVRFGGADDDRGMMTVDICGGTGSEEADGFRPDKMNAANNLNTTQSTAAPSSGISPSMTLGNFSTKLDLSAPPPSRKTGMVMLSAEQMAKLDGDEDVEDDAIREDMQLQRTARQSVWQMREQQEERKKEKKHQKEMSNGGLAFDTSSVGQGKTNSVISCRAVLSANTAGGTMDARFWFQEQNRLMRKYGLTLEDMKNERVYAESLNLDRDMGLLSEEGKFFSLRKAPLVCTHGCRPALLGETEGVMARMRIRRDGEQAFAKWQAEEVRKAAAQREYEKKNPYAKYAFGKKADSTTTAASAATTTTQNQGQEQTTRDETSLGDAVLDDLVLDDEDSPNFTGSGELSEGDGQKKFTGAYAMEDPTAVAQGYAGPLGASAGSSPGAKGEVIAVPGAPQLPPIEEQLYVAARGRGRDYSPTAAVARATQRAFVAAPKTAPRGVAPSQAVSRRGSSGGMELLNDAVHARAGVLAAIAMAPGVGHEHEMVPRCGFRREKLEPLDVHRQEQKDLAKWEQSQKSSWHFWISLILDNSSSVLVGIVVQQCSAFSACMRAFILLLTSGSSRKTHQ